MAVYSSQFCMFEVTNAAGTFVDITQYVTVCDTKRANKKTDLTTFATGGGPVTKTEVRGALQAAISLKMLFDPVPCKLMRQIIATRTGFTFRVRAGANQLPGQGDELFLMTATILSYSHPYAKDQASIIDYSLVPVDAGIIVPAFGSI